LFGNPAASNRHHSKAGKWGGNNFFVIRFLSAYLIEAIQQPIGFLLKETDVETRIPSGAKGLESRVRNHERRTFAAPPGD
jgi:hypothetical protein